MKKIIKFAVIIGVLIVGALTSYRIPVVRDTVASVLPLDLKIKIKRTLFAASALREDIALKDQEIGRLHQAVRAEQLSAEKIRGEVEKHKAKLIFGDVSGGVHASWPALSRIYSQSVNDLLLERSETSIAGSDGKVYQLTQYLLPFLPTALKHGYKPLFYVDSTDDAIYLVTGEGVVFTADKSELTKARMRLTSVPSNIRTAIPDPAIFTPGWFSIKDLKISDGVAYLSYNKKVGADYTLAILRADLGQSPLVFEDFFSLDDPISVREPFNAHQIGGRMVKFKDNQLLVSTGDYRKYAKGQDENSLLGKIFAIDIETKKTQIISKGHRNAQGLEYDPKSGAIVSTEHGPNGGDEINLNLNSQVSDAAGISNFGWPMASYGKHYDSKFHADAPLHQPHAKYGYLEPLKYYTPSVGISEVVKVPAKFAAGFSNDYFASTMGLNAAVKIFSLHHFRLDPESKKIIKESNIRIGERIRDIVVLDEARVMMALEGNSTPAIGILKAK